ncbi:ArsR/SmtB family transcription factor [Asaccharospora irregularis]|uniref:Transcriptional regulator, ArsR family n=1 Tax=Asaccharospora irregularis DSM 2635 TaxID=1121321 RepID=A0A1M5SC91_9FIRM|nr:MULTISPECIES: metalloregulator ArsR/SmtB family transcription factor [Peptostreptococcaceae]SHH36232.1 transcriptional regulator, ArsR family [Asaccharospora irregularis DSM 2635]
MNYSYAEYALMFKALSDETRLKILNMLSENELCACNILDEVNITQPTLSYHMKMLIECDLVSGRKDGSWMKYTLKNNKILELKDFLLEVDKSKENLSKDDDRCNLNK